MITFEISASAIDIRFRLLLGKLRETRFGWYDLLTRTNMMI